MVDKMASRASSFPVTYASNMLTPAARCRRSREPVDSSSTMVPIRATMAGLIDKRMKPPLGCSSSAATARSGARLSEDSKPWLGGDASMIGVSVLSA